ERIILNLPPIPFLIKKSKKVSFPGFQGLPLYDVVIFFNSQMRQVGINERAAAIAFNFLLAIPPLGIFLFTVLSNIPGSAKLYKEVLHLARQITPDNSTYRIIKSIADDFFKPGAELLSLGLFFAIYFSSNAMITIMRTFNKSMLHIEKEKRNFLQLRWEAIKLTILIVILVIATILILVTQGTLMEKFKQLLSIGKNEYNVLLEIIRFGLTFALIYFSIALIYRYAPSLEKKWKFASPGVMLATILIIIVTYLFSYWVNNFARYNKVYGSLGSILILMLLVFFNSMVLLIGFELNVSINSLKSIARKRNQAGQVKI
ncbi:MAG: YihY/virulence factor BrkB family protein, partial [Chitinophagaceae bacterium]